MNHTPDLNPDFSGLLSDIDDTRAPIIVYTTWNIREIDTDPNQKVTVDLTAREWELFTATLNCEAAAAALNAAATEALACGNHADAADIWETTATNWQDYGALDSEPRRVIASLLTARYGQSLI